MVRKGSGEERKWWRREAVKKGSDDEGEWWRREVVTKGSGDDGKWWRREVVTKGSGDEGKWWRWEVVRKGSSEEGKRWRREVVTMGSGDDGKWWGREVVSWGGSRSTKPCVFPGKVAAAGDERYLVCATVAAAVGLSFFFCRSVTVASSCFGCACVCVVIGRFGICACRSHWNGCMILHGLCFGGGSRSTKPCVFPCKVAAGDDERYLVCATVAAAVGLSFFFLPQCHGGFKLLWLCLCVRSYRVFWNLCLQIALEWLHDLAWAMFWGGSRSTKPCVFPCKVAAGDDERYLVCATVAAAVGLSFFFCRSVTVASSCFGCGCVCVVIGCFGICGCRSHWNGCMMLHGLCFGEEAGARNLVFFRVKWLQATMKGTSCVRRLRLRSVYRFFFGAVSRWLQAALGVVVCA